jgi:hypothetical protein
VLGGLVQTTAGKWITHPPSRCPTGILLGRIKSSLACRLLRTLRRSHTSWHCRTCDAVVYGPPLNTHCTTLDGPATVRISNTT